MTVPSWCAEYYLTGNIYVVDQDGVSRYHNRNPASDLTTRDHRLEHIRAGDVRDGLRTAVRDLPDAPCYVVLCPDAEDVDKWYARLETGFIGGNMLLHGSAMGMGCWFTTELSEDVQVSVREVAGVEAEDIPVVENLPDGKSVEIIAEAEKDILDEFIQHLDFQRCVKNQWQSNQFP